MIRLNLFMIWFLHFLSLLSVICRCYRQNSSSRIIVVLVYTVSTLFLRKYYLKKKPDDTTAEFPVIPVTSSVRPKCEGYGWMTRKMIGNP